MKKYKVPLEILPKWRQNLRGCNANGTPIAKLMYNQLKEDLDRSSMPKGMKSMYLTMLGSLDPITNKSTIEMYLDNWVACIRGKEVSREQRESVKWMQKLLNSIVKMFIVYDRRIGRVKASLNETHSRENIKASPHAEEAFKESEKGLNRKWETS
jgi:hypothetical protein